MKQKMILVLEDDPAISEMVSYILSGEGYVIQQCHSVSDFNSVITQQLPDLCVMDISLPDGNGLEVCKQLKENQQTATIPVLLMSARTNNEDLKSYHYHDDFISKPFDIIDFKNKVEQYA